VQPVYPEEVRAQEIEGIVKLELVVSPEGKVLSAKLLKRLHPLLDESAYNAAMAMSFSPATEDGKPVRVKIPWEFVFVLE
jgi:protein TonB